MPMSALGLHRAHVGRSARQNEHLPADMAITNNAFFAPGSRHAINYQRSRCYSAEGRFSFEHFLRFRGGADRAQARSSAPPSHEPFPGRSTSVHDALQARPSFSPRLLAQPCHDAIKAPSLKVAAMIFQNLSPPQPHRRDARPARQYSRLTPPREARGRYHGRLPQQAAACDSPHD